MREGNRDDEDEKTGWRRGVREGRRSGNDSVLCDFGFEANDTTPLLAKTILFGISPIHLPSDDFATKSHSDPMIPFASLSVYHTIPTLQDAQFLISLSLLPLPFVFFLCSNNL